MKLTINPQNNQPEFPISIELDGKTEIFTNLAHIEGNLEHLWQEHNSYVAYDAKKRPLLIAVFAQEIITLRVRESEDTAYVDTQINSDKYAHAYLEQDGNTIVRAVLVGIDGKYNSYPKAFDKEAALEFDSSAAQTQIDYEAFEDKWGKAQR